MVASFGDEVWDTSFLLRDDGLIGRALHALVGYVDRPMGVQVLAYLIVLFALTGIGAAMHRGAARPRTELRG